MFTSKVGVFHSGPLPVPCKTALNSWILIVRFTHYLLTSCKVERLLYTHILHPSFHSDPVIISQFLVKSMIFTFVTTNILTAGRCWLYSAGLSIFPGVSCFFPSFVVVHAVYIKISRSLPHSRVSTLFFRLIKYINSFWTWKLPSLFPFHPAPILSSCSLWPVSQKSSPFCPGFSFSVFLC